MKTLFALIVFAASMPAFAQKIPEAFRNAPLVNSGRLFGMEHDIPVKAVFRDQEFVSRTKLDGTKAYSRIKSQQFKGNDVFITVESVSGNELVVSIQWQLTYRATEHDVVVSSYEVYNAPDDERTMYRLDEARLSGADYKDYLVLMAQFLNYYFDGADIVRKWK